MFNKTINKAILFFFCISGIFYISCKHETIAPVDLGYKYYPSNIGHWVLYNVDSTYYNEYNHTVNHYKYQIKELFESTYLDNQGRATQRLERYEITDSLPTFLKNVWASNLTSSTAEKVEDNIRYIKLVFPIDEGKTWDGNAMNILDTIGLPNYEYSNVFKPYSINGFTFDSTVTVIQNVDSNVININNQVEVYAKNVGLIYKKYEDIWKQDTIHLNTITSGVNYTYQIVSFGN